MRTRLEILTLIVLATLTTALAGYTTAWAASAHDPEVIIAAVLTTIGAAIVWSIPLRYRTTARAVTAR